MLPVLGLVLLLLLSPCKVRNFIQAELGIPQTEVANKNQTTFSNSNCNDLEITSTTLVKEKPHYQYLPATIEYVGLAFNVTDITNNYFQPQTVRNHSASAIPLYILYQNFKDYL